MTTSLKKRDEERMKKNVDELVDDFKKGAEKEKMEDVKEEEASKEEQKPAKEAVTEKQQNGEDLKMKEEADGEAVTGEQQEKEADHNQTAEKAEVPITEVKTSTESKDLNRNVGQCKKCMETCSACTEKDKKFRTRDLEFTKTEKVFKEKCKEMLENEKILKDNDEKLT
ncbi:hypothetical protein Hanom_Chr08g00721251 [Helianthus anomalus]